MTCPHRFWFCSEQKGNEVKEVCKDCGITRICRPKTLRGEDALTNGTTGPPILRGSPLYRLHSKRYIGDSAGGGAWDNGIRALEG